MFRDHVRPLLQAESRGVIRSLVLRLCGMGECIGEGDRRFIG